MTVRVTAIGKGEFVILKVDGRLVGDELTEVLGTYEGEMARLILDLADLQFADRRGVSALRDLRARGVTFTGVSQYLRLLLDEPPGRPEP